MLETERGRIAVGWLIVEDLAMVLALVLLPALAGRSASGSASADRAGLAAGFRLADDPGQGRRLRRRDAGRRPPRDPVAAALHRPHRLARAVPAGRLAIALGVAFGAAELFGVSFALGAFFAGMVMGESALSQQAAEESLPLRDAFAVLFFVSVGMLFDPRSCCASRWPLLATVVIIVVGKSLAALLIVRAFRHPIATALTDRGEPAPRSASSPSSWPGSASSWSCCRRGPRPDPGRRHHLDRAQPADLRPARAAVAAPRSAAAAPAEAPATATPTSSRGHDVLVGYGRVGSLVGAGAARGGSQMVVIETSDEASRRRDATAPKCSSATPPTRDPRRGQPGAARGCSSPFPRPSRPARWSSRRAVNPPPRDPGAGPFRRRRRAS